MTGRPVVIAGLPRSGTTWTMQALAASPGVRHVLEADNEDKAAEAVHGKARLGRYPALAPGDVDPAYHRLWEWILGGAFRTRRSRLGRTLLGPGGTERIFDGRRDLAATAAGLVAANPRPGYVPPGQSAPDRVVAKSIHLPLALEWLDDAFPVDVLVLLRHPANVLASWMTVNLKDARNATLETRPEIRARFVDRWGVPLPGDDPVERMSWRIGLLLAALEEAVGRHPTWHVRVHEALCVDPVAAFRGLYDDLGLAWTGASERFLVEHDQPGEGFVVSRVSSELADAWMRKLDDGQVATLRRVLSWFPVSTWTDADFDRTRPPG